MNASETLRAKLLRVFGDLTCEQGYEQTTVRQIADLCGIGRGHLYFYYAKKEFFPIALRKDLLKKIDGVLNELFPEERDEHLLRFFLSLKLVRYLFSRTPEFLRAEAEYACHTEVMDGFAQLHHPRFAAALAGLGLSIDACMIEESLLSATYGEYALIKHRYGHSRERLDYNFLCGHFNGILFLHFPFLRETVAEQENRACDLFASRAEEMARLVQAMNICDYTEDAADER